MAVVLVDTITTFFKPIYRMGDSHPAFVTPSLTPTASVRIFLKNYTELSADFALSSDEQTLLATLCGSIATRMAETLREAGD